MFPLEAERVEDPFPAAVGHQGLVFAVLIFFAEAASRLEIGEDVQFICAGKGNFGHGPNVDGHEVALVT